LYGRLLTEREIENHQAATTLNDGVVQSLLGLHIWLYSHFNKSSARLDENEQTALSDSLTVIDDLIETVRVISAELWPIELDTVGLNVALQQASEQFSSLTQVEVVYAGEDNDALPEATAIALYRLAQELFDNIGKHAQAMKVQLTLSFNDRNVQLKIKDNGQGFANDGDDIIDPLKAPGLTLFGLMVYFQQLNGRITIQSQPGQGTIVTAILPLSP
jgi:two-component system NarL family sensor kinase